MYEATTSPPRYITKRACCEDTLFRFFGETRIDKISHQEVEQYKAKKIGEGFAKQSINYHLAILSSCLHTAQDWLELQTIPKIKRLKAPPAKTAFLSRPECELLLANSKGVWRDVILTALHTGLRRGELIALGWSNINWNNRTLTVQHSWCSYARSLTTPKSNRERHIPLTDELYKVLLKRRQVSGFVFKDKRSQRIDGQLLNQEIENACKRAGIKKISCHTLRHTFASHLAMAGAAIIGIKELLGHSDIQTTMRYAHLAPSTLRETVGLLETIKGPPTNFGHYTVNSEHLQTGMS